LVELEPDLIVNDMWDYPPTFWGLEPDTVEQVEPIAPIVNLLFIDRPITETIARVEELAVALGADLEAEQVAADKAAFDAAAAALQAAIAAKPGLAVAFVSGVPGDSFWVGNPMKLADLRFFQELGMDIVQPEDQAAYSEELSWEQAGKYPADLFIIDSLHGSGTGKELVAQAPSFAALPAAKAGAFSSWPSEYVPSYAGMTPVLESLAEAVRNADPDIV
jgi:iron complex transport system substrate-binding protein